VGLNGPMLIHFQVKCLSNSYLLFLSTFHITQFHYASYFRIHCEQFSPVYIHSASLKQLCFSLEYYQNTHRTQYRCTHYALVLTARCFQSVCSSVTAWCIILFPTNSSTLPHMAVNFLPAPHQSNHCSAGNFS
jgi:hypothetical protein